jgi:hypothetical protein
MGISCHRKCCYTTTIGLTLTICCIAVVAFMAYCEQLYENEDYICSQKNLLVCDICETCNSTAVCTPTDLNLYCGVDCASITKDITDMKCADRVAGIGIIFIFGVIGGTAAIGTTLYFLREACQTLTGTQNLEDA